MASNERYGDVIGADRACGRAALSTGHVLHYYDFTPLDDPDLAAAILVCDEGGVALRLFGRHELRERVAHVRLDDAGVLALGYAPALPGIELRGPLPTRAPAIAFEGRSQQEPAGPPLSTVRERVARRLGEIGATLAARTGRETLEEKLAKLKGDMKNASQQKKEEQKGTDTQKSEQKKSESKHQEDLQREAQKKLLPDLEKLLEQGKLDDAALQSIPEAAFRLDAGVGTALTAFFQTPLVGKPPEGFKQAVEEVLWTLPDGRKVPILVAAWAASGPTISYIQTAFALSDPALPREAPRESRIHWTKLKFEHTRSLVYKHVTKSTKIGLGLGLGLGLSQSFQGVAGPAAAGVSESAPALASGDVMATGGVMAKFSANLQRVHTRIRLQAFERMVAEVGEMQSAPLFGPGAKDPGKLP